MVKRIIPENMRPWVCVINGVRYTYEAGTEQYVPDEVAVLIDKYWAEQETDYPETGISFNDLRDRPFGESTEVLFDQRVEIDAENGNFEECELPFSPGDLVKVTWDGVEYKCTVELYEGNVFLGNPEFVGGASNGLPFVMAIGEFDSKTILAIIAPDYHGQSVSIKIEGNVIHPIDPKFLPEGVGGGGVMLYANEANYLFKSDDLGEESAVSMDELLGYAMEARAVVVVPYGGLDSFQFLYAGSIYRVTTEVPYYGQIYTFGGSYYYTKEKVYEEAPS